MIRLNNPVLVIVTSLVMLVGIFVFVISIAISESDQNNRVYSSISSSTSAVGSSNSPVYATLPPAAVPSKVAECSQQITFTSNGDSGPVQCGNGDLNITEWNSLSALEPSVMKLGYNATSVQVRSALCADVHANISNPLEETAYHISVLYYGWHFTIDPSIVIQNGTCQNVDD